MSDANPQISRVGKNINDSSRLLTKTSASDFKILLLKNCILKQRSFPSVSEKHSRLHQETGRSEGSRKRKEGGWKKKNKR